MVLIAPCPIKIKGKIFVKGDGHNMTKVKTNLLQGEALIIESFLGFLLQRWHHHRFCGGDDNYSSIKD
jgi:hypothetical protein